MASTAKVSLSLDAGALVLARRAAAIEGMALSAYVSAVLRRHAWESEQPARTPDEQSRADALAAELDDRERDEWGAGEHRAAG